jgi:hypothetical protein
LSLASCLVAAQPPREALADAAKPVVHVFLQLDVKASVVERTLRDRLPGLAITVFGRYRDFEEALGSGHPDAIVSIAPVLTEKGKVPTLQGERGGKTTEAYVLASVNQVLEGSLSGKNIGVVDLFGRDGTQAFLDGLLKTTDVRVKRVAKIEDLLPLLEFSAADGIVLPGSTMAQLAERTRLVIKTKDVPGPPVGLSAVAVLNPAVRDTVIKAFESLDGPTKQLLGVDRWRAR